jgi:hypothetical protein
VLVEIRRAVVPPRRTALAERHLIIAGVDNLDRRSLETKKICIDHAHCRAFLRGDTVSLPGIALIDDLQSWRVLSVLDQFKDRAMMYLASRTLL